MGNNEEYYNEKVSKFVLNYCHEFDLSLNYMAEYFKTADQVRERFNKIFEGYYKSSNKLGPPSRTIRVLKEMDKKLKDLKQMELSEENAAKNLADAFVYTRKENKDSTIDNENVFGFFTDDLKAIIEAMCVYAKEIKEVIGDLDEKIEQTNEKLEDANKAVEKKTEQIAQATQEAKKKGIKEKLKNLLGIKGKTEKIDNEIKKLNNKVEGYKGKINELSQNKGNPNKTKKKIEELNKKVDEATKKIKEQQDKLDKIKV